MPRLKQEVAVEVEGQDGQPVALTIRPPNPAVRRQIERATRQAYCEAIRAGYPTGPGAEDEGWEQLRAAIRTGAEHLGRADLSLAERQRIALAMRENRNALRSATYAAAQRDPTAESLAGQVRFELLVALCVYGQRGRLFRGADEFRRQAGDPFHYRIAQAVGRVFYGLEGEPPEEQFLREHSL
ncbi:MAG TPA: hypothetical protein VGE74_15050 [Gemmata sp.]